MVGNFQQMQVVQKTAWQRRMLGSVGNAGEDGEPFVCLDEVHSDWDELGKATIYRTQ